MKEPQKRMSIEEHIVKQSQVASAMRHAREHMGFLPLEGVQAIANYPPTRLTPIMVRCGGGRFTAPADQVAHFIAIIEKEGSDYVRDLSLGSK